MTTLVLLSGWGIDARIWQPLAPHWPADISVSAPDWPGYGGCAPLDAPGSLSDLAAAMADTLREDAIWVGWSLGALLAASLLEHLPPPRALLMLGMGERFISTVPGGVTPHELAAFRRAFAREPARAWRHFLRWQLSGELDPRDAYRRLDDLLDGAASKPDALPANEATLAAGLEQLATLDAGRRLAHPPCPILRLRGGDDPLIAPADGGEHAILAGAGHCPQLSMPAALARLLGRLARDPAPVSSTVQESDDGR